MTGSTGNTMTRDGDSALMPGLQLSKSYFMERMHETSIRNHNVSTTNDRILTEGFKIGGMNGHTSTNGARHVSCYYSMLNIREMVCIVLRPQAIRALIITVLNKTVSVG